MAAGAWGKSVQTKLPDGRTRISSEKNQLVSLWDLTTRQLRHQFVLLDERVGPVAFAPDGALLAAAVGGPKPRLRLWNTEAAKEVGLVQGFHGNVRSMAFSPDGKSLAVADTQAIVVLWDTDTWKQKGKIEGPEDLMINSLAFSPNGKFLAWGCEDQTVQIWEVATGKLVTTLPGHSEAVTEVAYGSGDNTLASGAQDGDVRLWNTSSGQTRITLK